MIKKARKYFSVLFSFVAIFLTLQKNALLTLSFLVRGEHVFGVENMLEFFLLKELVFQYQLID